MSQSWMSVCRISNTCWISFGLFGCFPVNENSDSGAVDHSNGGDDYDVDDDDFGDNDEDDCIKL